MGEFAIGRNMRIKLKDQRRIGKVKRKAMLPAQVDPSIIVIGANCYDDCMTLVVTASWFENNRPTSDLSRRIRNLHYDLYDMATLPEKGDALDHISADTQLVIACHLFGVTFDEQGVKISPAEFGYTEDEMQAATRNNSAHVYNRDNDSLVDHCMRLGVPVVFRGTQPELVFEKTISTQMHPNRLWLYEPPSTVENVA
jgi:hypothetical protein